MNNRNGSRLAARLSDWATQLKGSAYLQTGWGLSALCLITGVLMLGSRVLGSFTPDADSVRALGGILLVNGVVLSVDWGLLKASQNRLRSVWETLLWPGLFFAGTALITLAMLPGGSTLTVLSGIGTLLLLGYFLAEISLDAISSKTDLPHSLTASGHVDSPDSLSESVGPSESEGHLTQWLSRKQDEQGADVIEGMIRLELAAGQIQKAAHVAFTPSFSSVPQMECEPLGDAEVEVILGDVYPHGFRVEIRRTDSNREATEVEVGFRAVCAGASQSAA